MVARDNVHRMRSLSVSVSSSVGTPQRYLKAGWTETGPFSVRFRTIICLTRYPHVAQGVQIRRGDSKAAPKLECDLVVPRVGLGPTSPSLRNSDRSNRPGHHRNSDFASQRFVNRHIAATASQAHPPGRTLPIPAPINSGWNCLRPTLSPQSRSQ
jgi:hypothetical protein